MKKVVLIAICTVSLLALSACGSTSPCGLAKVNEVKHVAKNQSQVLLAEVAYE
ncbi:MAG: hypothetical protein ACK5H1_01945 [Tenacibaculum sp.]